MTGRQRPPFQNLPREASPHPVAPRGVSWHGQAPDDTRDLGPLGAYDAGAHDSGHGRSGEGHRWGDDPDGFEPRDTPRRAAAPRRAARSRGSSRRDRAGRSASRPDTPGRGAARRRVSAVAPWWAKLCVWLGALLMLGSGGALVGGNILESSLASNVETDNLLGDDARKTNNGRVALDGPINMLLLGSDKRKGWSSAQSDTIIMLHVPREHDRAFMISFQRDTLVDIPANRKSGYGGGQDKVNAAFGAGGRRANGEFNVAGGFRLMAQTLHNTTGVEFNTGAVIDFKGFLKTVEVLGGVHMCVETPKGTKSFKSIHKPYRTFKKGCQHLTPKQALDYSRQRKQFDSEPGGGDFARMRHQQQLIKAILKQAISKGFDDPTKIPSLVKAAGKSLLVDESIPLADLAWTLRKVTPESLTAIKVPVQALNMNGISYQQLVEGDADSLFKAIREETLDSWVLQHEKYINDM